MRKKPFFSIVVCTRNRPDIIKPTLLALQNQSFKDFEVILSDNSDPEIREKNQAFIEGMGFSQLKCIFPDRVLNMHENYNFALNQAKGLYVGALTDKNLLKRDALKELQVFLKDTQVDIVNYRHGGCYWFPKKIFKWCWEEGDISGTGFEFYNPKDELSRRFCFQKSIYQEGIFYSFGKIFFGFFHYTLINRIKQKHQEVFHGLSPDYTSAALALSHAKTAAFCHEELMIAINSYSGTGQTASVTPHFTMNFIKGCVDDVETLLRNLPIPQVYTFHNLCAYDYQVLNRFGNRSYQINLTNLAQHVYEDLQIFPYASQEEKEKLWAHFNAFVQEKNIRIDRTTIVSKKTTHPPSPREKLLAFCRSKNKLKILYNIFIYNPFKTRYFSLYAILK